MDIEISSTEVVRNFGDCLARVKHRGDRFVVTKNSKPVAEIRPFAMTSKTGNLGDILDIWKSDPEDPGFADDLAGANSTEEPRLNKWGS